MNEKDEIKLQEIWNNNNQNGLANYKTYIQKSTEAGIDIKDAEKFYQETASFIQSHNGFSSDGSASGSGNGSEYVYGFYLLIILILFGLGIWLLLSIFIFPKLAGG